MALMLGAGPLYSAIPGLPFTEDFTDDNLKDATQTTADWNVGLEQLVLPGSGPVAVSLSDTFDETSAPINFGDFVTRGVALGDLNGNGHLDLIEGNFGQNRVLFNDGSGNFTPVYATSEEENTREIVIADVNGDGSNDFVVVNFNGRARVYLNDGTGENYVMQPVTSRNRRGMSMALVDINNNGLPDVVIAAGEEGGEQYNVVVLNTGDPAAPYGPGGSPGIPLDESVIEPSQGVVVGDVDNDGDLDIIFLNGTDAGVADRIHLNTPGACGAEPVCFTHEPLDGTARYSRAGALGDLNGNGLLDLVVVGPKGSAAAWIYYNQGNGADANPYTAPPHVLMAVPDPLVDDPIAWHVKLADLNNNGLLDIVLALRHPLHRNRIYFNDQQVPLENPPFASFVEIGADPADPGSGADDNIAVNEIAIGDLNGDGKLDLVFVNQTPAITAKYNQVYLNSGTADGPDALQLRGYATSERVDAGEAGTIRSVRLTADTTSVGPQFHNEVDFWVSSNGGSYWAPIRPNGKPINIAVPGEELHWRAFLRSISPFEAGALAVDELTLSANILPIANGDSYDMNQGDTLNIAAPGVLANDSDPDGDDSELTAVLAQGVSNGTLTLNADGSFSYTPNAAFFGTDSFSYRASDGALSDTAVVTINVNGLPVANDNTYSVEVNTTRNVAAPGVLGNDVDPDGDALTATLVTDVNNGTLTLNADGSFSYTPAADFVGTDSFTYQAGDGMATSNVATVTLVVDETNEPPVAADDSYEVAGHTLLTVPAPGVLGNDSDPDGDTLTAVLVQGVGNGAMALNADGSFTYAPGIGFSGTDTFQYQASDGAELSNVATVTITVTPAAPGSNAPPVANDDAYSVETSGTLVVDEPGILENDYDPNGDAVTAVLVDDVNDGVLTMNADGSFTYTPDPGFTGQDLFTYVATDGVLVSNLATVTISVGAANEAPVAVDDEYQTDWNTVLEVAVPGVLGNDTDADGDTLTAVLVRGPDQGSLTFNADGSFTYTPDTGFSGDDSFSYQASDGLALSNVATVSVTVGENPSPVFTSTPITGITEAQEYLYLITTQHPDDAEVTISALTVPDWLTLTDNGDGTGELRGTPTGAEVGQHPVELLVQLDPPVAGLDDSQAFTVTVTAAEEGPVITLNGSSTVTVLQGGTYVDVGATATDPQDGDLTDQIQVNNPVDTSTPGTYTVTYSVQDSAGNTAQVQRTVIVQAVASPPPPSRRSGGGSVGLEVLVLLVLAAATAGIRRRRYGS